jgi:hypothetical protein
LRKFIVIALLISVCGGYFLAAPGTVSACSCAGVQDPLTELNRASAVFAGKVVRVDEGRSVFGGFVRGVLGLGSPDYLDVNTLEVNQVWKGQLPAKITVYDAGHEESCGYDFKEGQSYLVYAYTNQDGDLITSYCNRTTLLSGASADLQQLGAGAKPGVNADADSGWFGGTNAAFTTAIGALVVILLMVAVYFVKRRRL